MKIASEKPVALIGCVGARRILIGCVGARRFLASDLRGNVREFHCMAYKAYQPITRAVRWVLKFKNWRRAPWTNSSQLIDRFNLGLWNSSYCKRLSRLGRQWYGSEAAKIYYFIKIWCFKFKVTLETSKTKKFKKTDDITTRLILLLERIDQLDLSGWESNQ